MLNKNELEELELDAGQAKQAAGGKREPITSSGLRCPQCHQRTMTQEMTIINLKRFIIRSCPCGYKEAISAFGGSQN